MSYLCQWHCLFSTSGHENCMKMNGVCTVCMELYFQTIQEGSLEFIFVCAHEYVCLLPFGTSCAFSTWGYKNSWGTPWSPAGIPAQSEFRGDGKFDCVSLCASIRLRRRHNNISYSKSLKHAPWRNEKIYDVHNDVISDVAPLIIFCQMIPWTMSNVLFRLGPFAPKSLSGIQYKNVI